MIPNLFNLKVADRGLRIPHGNPNARHVQDAEHEFKKKRAYRLTASTLPMWVRLGKSSMSRQRMVRIMNAHEGVFERPIDDHTRQLMEYGRINEERALRGYHELTRFMVGLGSTRFRDLLRGEEPLAHDSKTFEDVTWGNVLGATPDGFIADPSDDHTVGLIEIKCPAHWRTRHDVDLPIDFHDDHSLLLQVWEQLEVVQQAQFCDLVKYKKTNTNPVQEYLWIARLYRDEEKMAEIKATLKPSFESFAEAVLAMKEDAEMTESESESKSRATHNLQNGELPVRDGTRNEWTPRVMKTGCDTSKIKTALNNWCYTSLKFRDSIDEGYPWKTEAEIRSVGLDPNERLIRRYHVQTEECAIYFDRKHQTIGLTAADLWTREFVA